MGKSNVYFTDFRTKIDVPITEKLKQLCRKAGIGSIDMNGKFVAIKMHFGELGNVAYLRPNYARAIVDLVKEQNGLPFLTDCNTLYVGSRRHALEHLDCANINGFNPITTGCQIIIGDGLRGTDDIEVPVPNGEFCETALIGRAIMDADIFISLTHVKAHEVAGLGGVIKNIGMGCGSRAGKMQQHDEGTPVVLEDKCVGCRRCSKECGSDAITYENNKAHIEEDICKGCGRCIGACAFDAIQNKNWDAKQLLGAKMAEYTAAVCSGRPAFHVAMIMDVSPNCDCHMENDAPIIPDIGMLASFDPVALDQACSDLCNQAVPFRNSRVGDHLAKPGWKDFNDLWKNNHPRTDSEKALIHGEKIGLGSREYELIKM